MKHYFLILPAIILFLSQQGFSQFKPNAWYKLSSLYQPTKSLDVVNDGKNYDQLVLDKTQNLTGQSWKITPIKGEAGYYRLSPQYQPTKSLDVVNDGKNYNQVVLDKTQNLTGQSWKITPIKGRPRHYRLSPQYQPTKSLDVINDGKNFNQVQLSKTGLYTGQFWKIDLIEVDDASPTNNNLSSEAISTVAPENVSIEQTYTVKTGELIKIVLKSNPSTGYMWNLEEDYDKKVVAFEKQDYVGSKSENGMVGKGGNATFTFKGIKKGETYIVMKYKRSQEDEAVNTKTYKIVVTK